jgi:DNA-directed RNA polymerase subunit RPC12/RpoP
VHSQLRTCASHHPPSFHAETEFLNSAWRHDSPSRLVVGSIRDHPLIRGMVLVRLSYCLECGGDLRVDSNIKGLTRPARCPLCGSDLVMSGLPALQTGTVK